MIYIELINEPIEGETPPILYWRGSPNDYLDLMETLHPLATNDGNNILLKSISHISLVNIQNILLKSSANGNILVKNIDGNITIDLDHILWREILIHFLVVSFENCHSYIEFDDHNLIEDANFIISSEF